MTESSWGDFQRRNIEKFDAGLEKSWDARLEFWKHVVMVEATILALSVGLLSVGASAPPMLLVGAWMALLLAIVTGCILILLAIDLQQAQRFVGFRVSYDVAEIKGRVARGELAETSEEFRGLMVAAILQGTPKWQRRRVFTDQGIQLLETWSPRLPSAALTVQRESVLVSWLGRHREVVETTFNVLSIAAILLLGASILGPRARGDTSREAGARMPAESRNTGADSIRSR